MSISKLVDFSNITNAKVLFSGTKQWNILHKMNESEWKSYTNKMLGKKIIVEYDTQTSAYIAKPIKETSMSNTPTVNKDNQSKYLLQDDEMDMESDAMDLINSIDTEEEEIEDEPMVAVKTAVEVPTTPITPIEPSINLAQFENLLNKILGGSKGEIEVPAEKPENQDETSSTFLGNPLDSEFDANSESISFLDSNKFDIYQSKIDSDYSSKQSKSAPEQTDSEEFEYNDEEEYPDEDNFEDDTETSNTDKSYIGTDGHVYDSTGASKVNTGFLEEDEEEIEPVTKSGIANVGGTPVQIILTGVMITPSEVNFVAESAKKAGMKLKSVKGTGKVVNFMVESSGKQYNIRYEDMPKSKKPSFSIKAYTFKTLDEALKKINYAKTQKINEAKSFKNLISNDIANRDITNIKESTLLSDFKGKISKDYIQSWNVKVVGSINLKNGLNETYSNITEHSKEENVLVQTKDGQYFMMKGNLKERSGIGTKRNLVDLDGKKDFGVGTVVGLYENSIIGLGKIMYKVKKTTLPLLTWK
ncbi:MAG: hypothetical protein ABIP51_07830 [Bacteroidia bacterium]